MALSVLSLNIWHDAGPWERRRALIRAWLERLRPDLIGLQEVLVGEDRSQLRELFDDLPYHTAYVGASRFERKGHAFAAGEFGNAVASVFPIVARETLALPDGGDGETRAAVSVTVDAPVGPVAFTSTHLNWKFRHGAIRERQVLALCDFVLGRRPRQGFPPIVVGDFNAEPESAEIRYVTGLQSLDGRSVSLVDAWRMAGDGGPGITWSNRNPYAADALEPDRRIDYVFAGWPRRDGLGQVTACRVVCDREEDGVLPSDHYGVFAELRTEPLPGTKDAWGLAAGDDVTDA